MISQKSMICSNRVVKHPMKQSVKPSMRNFSRHFRMKPASIAYFANVAKVAEKKPTILGHFDLIKKINSGNKFFDENDPRYTAAANSALMAAARNRCVLEVNTSAAYRGFRKDYFPSDAILKDWLVLSGNVVLTADVHDVKALTYGFEDAAAKLKELGYTKVQVLGKDGFTPCAL